MSQNLLSYSVSNEFMEIVRSLMDGGYHEKFLQRRDAIYEKPLLYWAAFSGQLETTKLLLDWYKFEIDARGTSVLAKPALICAAEKGHTEMVKLLLAQGASVNQTDHYECTALWHAAKHGFLDTVKVLIDAGARVGVVEKYDKIPLFTLAVTNGLKDLKYDLAMNIAWPLLYSRSLKTGEVLTLGVFNRVVDTRAAVGKILAEHGARMDYHSRSNGQLPAGRFARFNRQLPADRFAYELDLAPILGVHLDLDLRRVSKFDKKKRILLMRAAMHNSHEVAQLLVSRGADVFKTDRKGRTPLELAQDDRMVKILYSGMSFS
jgi:ankyrin repeat protein